MIKFDNVTKKYHYSQFAVFEGLSFELQKNNTYTLLIDTQSGKTTICKLLMGIEKPDSGQIFFDGKNIFDVKSRDTSIAYLSCDLLLFENKTVAYNILSPLRIRKVARDIQMQQLDKVACKFHLENELNCKVKNLSEFQKLCVALARIYARRAQLLLFDGVFERSTDECRQMMSQFIAEYDGTVVVFSSDIQHTFGHCLLISDSKVVAEGDSQKVADEQQKLLWLFKNSH